MLSDMQDIKCSASYSFNGSACIFTPFEVYISLVMHIVLINYMYLLFSCMDCLVANIPKLCFVLFLDVYKPYVLQTIF